MAGKAAAVHRRASYLVNVIFARRKHVACPIDSARARSHNGKRVAVEKQRVTVEKQRVAVEKQRVAVEKQGECLKDGRHCGSAKGREGSTAVFVSKSTCTPAMSTHALKTPLSVRLSVVCLPASSRRALKQSAPYSPRESRYSVLLVELEGLLTTFAPCNRRSRAEPGWWVSDFREAQDKTPPHHREHGWTGSEIECNFIVLFFASAGCRESQLLRGRGNLTRHVLSAH
ncbi:hypothetical protein B0T26DRAFT_193695 [Lasiosphaeria miniovina]|uniref:Uncharacterized protein n=1 Tax=Lasiosphaeria miniovina TaxID=1954250 RepID=A0AA40ATQ2_9PEZI|nr:uncharacterized protein B0T26DRAFT_193695 [Lasiosphaeria miniovina]KAK0721840.1 hypothetical protein B0T26DRAFT_193695 [Lasiosphaeria miniovina]